MRRFGLLARVLLILLIHNAALSASPEASSDQPVPAPRVVDCERSPDNHRCHLRQIVNCLTHQSTTCPMPVTVVDNTKQSDACRHSLYQWRPWQQGDDFVVLRDAKMCLPPYTRHGIAMPAAPVPGIEGARLPKRIWAFAWQIGLQQNIDVKNLSLVVNSPSTRTQDHLHVHIVTYRPDRIAACRSSRPCFSREVNDLGEIWETARALAAAGNLPTLPTYGILVFRTPGREDTYTVMIDANTQEGVEHFYTHAYP